MERDDEHLTASSAEVKNEWSRTSTLPPGMLSWRAQGQLLNDVYCRCEQVPPIQNTGKLKTSRSVRNTVHHIGTVCRRHNYKLLMVYTSSPVLAQRIEIANGHALRKCIDVC
jgi:hypothetical protein